MSGNLPISFLANIAIPHRRFRTLSNCFCSLDCHFEQSREVWFARNEFDWNIRKNSCL